ncbi:hypothetical protein [Bacillus sp. JJ1773]
MRINEKAQAPYEQFLKKKKDVSSAHPFSIKVEEGLYDHQMADH